MNNACYSYCCKGYLAKKVLYELQERKKTLAVAESCTGGYIAHLLTRYPGASRVFLGAAIAYSNETKKRMLGLDDAILTRYGAVSRETAQAMVQGVLKNFQSDYAIAVTGIAGPTSDATQEAIGTVWVAVANASKEIVRRFIFACKRQKYIDRTAQTAMVLLLELVQ